MSGANPRFPSRNLQVFGLALQTGAGPVEPPMEHVEEIVTRGMNWSPAS